MLQSKFLTHGGHPVDGLLHDDLLNSGKPFLPHDRRHLAPVHPGRLERNPLQDDALRSRRFFLQIKTDETFWDQFNNVPSSFHNLKLIEAFSFGHHFVKSFLTLVSA